MEDVVEVAADHARRNHARTEVDALDIRQRGRQHVLLDLIGVLQLTAQGFLLDDLLLRGFEVGVGLAEFKVFTAQIADGGVV